MQLRFEQVVVGDLLLRDAEIRLHRDHRGEGEGASQGRLEPQIEIVSFLIFGPP